MTAGEIRGEEALVIGAAITEDMAAVARIYAHYVRNTAATFEQEPPDEAEWLERFHKTEAGGYPFLVATIAGEVAGYAYCSSWRPRPAYRYAGEDTVYVAPHATGKGIGGRLIAELVNQAKAAGLHQLIAVISLPTGADVSTSGSITLHRRQGFDIAGRLTAVGYKFDRWYDTVLMQRALTSG